MKASAVSPSWAPRGRPFPSAQTTSTVITGDMATISAASCGRVCSSAK